MPETRQYAYQHALMPGRVIDLDAERERAIQQCYRQAVSDGYYPVAKPKVLLDLNNIGWHHMDLTTPKLRVTVQCLP